MNVRFRLTLMSFLQFFVWGAWLITIANYWFGTKQWDGTQFGAIFATMGFASLVMPTLTGIIADKWVNAEVLYGILHILYAAVLFYLPQVDTPNSFFWVMLLAMCFYMPTISLSNSISYTTLKNTGLNVIRNFPPIRVWGTIGFIVAMWTTNLTGNKATAYQFYIAGIAALTLGIYAMTLPKCKPQQLTAEKKLAIPFFLKHFGIKKVIVIAMFAWVLRFGFFAYGDPASNLWMIVMSCIVYGMAFDFFNISGSMFVETSTTPKTRSSAQGLFMMMTNGFGAVLGSLVSGWMIDKYFTRNYTDIKSLAAAADTDSGNTHLLSFLKNKGISVLDNGSLSRALDVKDWHHIWLSFTIYALAITVIFALVFKHKHNRAEQEAIDAMNH
jgi:hypothetical protein